MYPGTESPLLRATGLAIDHRSFFHSFLLIHHCVFAHAVPSTWNILLLFTSPSEFNPGTIFWEAFLEYPAPSCAPPSFSVEMRYLLISNP